MALKDSSFSTKLTQRQNRTKKNETETEKLQTSANHIINIKSNIGERFIKLIDKHFPKSSKMQKIFKRKTFFIAAPKICYKS